MTQVTLEIGRAALRPALAALVLSLTLVTPAAAKCSDSPGPGVDWSKCEREKRRLSGLDLRGGLFERSDFTYSDLSGSNLTDARLARAKLQGARFKDAKLNGADMTKVEGSRADFSGADLARAILVKAELARADFSGTDLTDADMSKGEFPRAVFRDAGMENVDLRFANLSRADLTGARLADADIGGAYTLLARFEGTDLSRVAGLDQRQLEIACGDSETALPPGLAAPDTWPCEASDRE